MEKIREEFEAKYIKSLNNNYFSCEEEKLVCIKRNDNGDYVHNLTYAAFHWWKASRAALCVELPATSNGNCFGEIYFPDQITDSLDKAGVSYK